MIIEKIELENFLCYSGKNIMEFTEGINVIIGDNGYGKSKLYDAFYWVMYDEVFVSEQKKFQPTAQVRSNIISDKAKFELNDGEVFAMVNITFREVPSGNVYIVERKYCVTIKDGELLESSRSERTVIQKDFPGLTSKIISDKEEAQKICERILPFQVKDYLWFQGEQVESIINFNEQDTLTKAINVLSNISRYDEIKEIAIAAAKSGRAEYDREARRQSTDAGRSSQLEREKADLEKEIDRLQAEENEISDNLLRAEERHEFLVNRSGDTERIKRLSQRKEDLIAQIEELKMAATGEEVAFHKRMFRNKWILKGTEVLQLEYSQKFDNYDKKRTKGERLPLDVPEPLYIQRMLDLGKCLVCDREAKEGSPAWNSIKALMERSRKSDEYSAEEQLAKHDFYVDFKRLYQNGLALTHRIADIDGDIQETLGRIQAVNNKIKGLARELHKAEEDIQEVLKDTSLTLEDTDRVSAEYSIQFKNVKLFSEKLGLVRQKLDTRRNGLRTKTDELQSLIVGPLAERVTKKREILNDFETIASSTRDRVFSNLIQQLENEANRHYGAMTEGNKSTRGKVKFRKLSKGNYMPEINDDRGNLLMGANTSNLILVKLSAIMAIISAKSSAGLVDLYTLITDAPTSVFGEDYTIGFCKTISKVYRQSILMSKEFYKNEQLRAELLNNPDIRRGRIYEITPSILAAERDNRNNLSTNIKRLL
jgi:DNA sulfur modification protein DndD